MTQKSIKFSLNETFSKPPIKNYTTNKTDLFYIDNFWSLGILDLKDYGPENKKNIRYVLVVFHKVPNFGWTVLLRNKNVGTIKDSSKKVLMSSKRKPILIETDRGKEF